MPKLILMISKITNLTVRINIMHYANFYAYRVQCRRMAIEMIEEDQAVLDQSLA